MSDIFEATSQSTSGGPDITFTFAGDTFTASLAGAQLYGEREDDNGSRIRLTDKAGEVLALVTAHPRSHRTATENAMDVGSALLWSHWRYVNSVSASPIPAAGQGATT